MPPPRVEALVPEVEGGEVVAVPLGVGAGEEVGRMAAVVVAEEVAATTTLPEGEVVGGTEGEGQGMVEAEVRMVVVAAAAVGDHIEARQEGEGHMATCSHRERMAMEITKDSRYGQSTSSVH